MLLPGKLLFYLLRAIEYKISKEERCGQVNFKVRTISRTDCLLIQTLFLVTKALLTSGSRACNIAVLEGDKTSIRSPL